MGLPRQTVALLDAAREVVRDKIAEMVLLLTETDLDGRPASRCRTTAIRRAASDCRSSARGIAGASAPSASARCRPHRRARGMAAGGARRFRAAGMTVLAQVSTKSARRPGDRERSAVRDSARPLRTPSWRCWLQPSPSWPSRERSSSCARGSRTMPSRRRRHRRMSSRAPHRRVSPRRVRACPSRHRRRRPRRCTSPRRASPSTSPKRRRRRRTVRRR